MIRRVFPCCVCAAMALQQLACGAPPESPHVCSTPADMDAPADVTMNARDVTIDIADGVQYPAWTYDGDVPGPILRVAVGQTRRIKLINQSPRATSLHFHGVQYANTDDGSNEESIVYPGCAHVYAITAHAPGVWPYHSHVDARVQMANGLYGAVVVPDPGEMPADHEYIAMLGQLGLEEEGAAPDPFEDEEEPPFAMTINGRAQGHASVIEWRADHYEVTHGAMASARVGERVRWRVANLSPDALHTFHLHGHHWCDHGGVANSMGVCPSGTQNVDNVDVAPAQGLSFEYAEEAPGDWMYHCHILDHVTDGMWAMYHVTP